MGTNCTRGARKGQDARGTGSRAAPAGKASGASVTRARGRPICPAYPSSSAMRERAGLSPPHTATVAVEPTARWKKFRWSHSSVLMCMAGLPRASKTLAWPNQAAA